MVHAAVTPPSPASPQSPSLGQPCWPTLLITPNHEALPGPAVPPHMPRHSRRLAKGSPRTGPRSLCAQGLFSTPVVIVPFPPVSPPQPSPLLGNRPRPRGVYRDKVRHTSLVSHGFAASGSSVLASLSMLHPSPCSLRSTLHPILLSATTSRHGH